MPALESPTRTSHASVPVQAERRFSLQGFDATRVEMGDTGDLRNTDNDPNAVRVKGINFLAFLDGVSKCFGATSRLDLEKGMGGEIGDAIKFGGIVAGGWYKVSWYRLLWRTAVDLLNLDEAHCRRLSQKATAISVNIAYRTLAKITSPTLLINACPRVYSTYFDKGQLVVLSSEPGKFVVEWNHCNGFDALLWNHLISGSAYFLEAAGATAVQVAVLGGGGENNWLRVSFSYR
jgi:hypothetical protein